MKSLFFFLIATALLSACSMNLGTDSTGSGTALTASGTDNIAKVSPTTIEKNTIATVNYTLRKDTQDGPIVETTVESVARTAGLYKEGMTYQPFEVMIGVNSVIPGFENGLLGMKKGEKKTIEVPPEIGYGTGPILRPAEPKSNLAPVFTVTEDVALFGDTITQEIPKDKLREDMRNVVVGQVLTGSDSMTAKVTAVSDTSVTLAFDNVNNPFRGKKLAPGVSVDDEKATYKVTKLVGTGVTIEISNKMSPFYGKKFAVGESFVPAQGGRIIIKEITDDEVITEYEHPFMNVKLFFEVEVIDIK